MEEITGEPKAGLSRRSLIKRGAVAGGIIWTTPLILESVASAQALPCSPCTCTTAYSAKWNTNLAGLCSAVAGPPETAGPSGIDPSCGNVTGGAPSYSPGGLTQVEVVSCSTTGTTSGSVTFRLKCNGHFYGYGVKGASDCTLTTGGICTNQVTLAIPSNLSHIVLYWCCC